eukprot:4680719-Prymnesium_polylepis.2
MLFACDPRGPRDPRVCSSWAVHVLLARAPAVALYERLGFRFGPNSFPSFLDWDGGFEGSTDAAAVLAKLPPHAKLNLR